MEVEIPLQTEVCESFLSTRKSERENQLLKERMEALEKQLEKVISLVEKVEMLSKSCT